jgi:predicted aldo/keto reductase-like oxidoreductase
MQYRKIPELGWKISALGFGAMRLPRINGENDKIDEAEAERILHYAIDNGVNYVDTAVHYCGGNSEYFLGRALKNGYRDKVKLITKLFPPNVKNYEDLDKQLNMQLEKLQTDRLDIYLLHGINKLWWPRLRDLDIFSWAEKAQADGRIGHLGFSFHDEFPVFKEIVDAYDKWALCMIQYNFMNGDMQAGTKGLKYAAAKNIPVAIMEPLFGGILANPSPSIQELWNKAAIKRSAAEWALQWLWNEPEVSVVLSGMSTMEQVKENIAAADRSGVGILSGNELELINKVGEKYRELSPIPCTGCGYCIPCPQGVDIPYNFKLYNDGMLYEKGNPERMRFWYYWMGKGGFEGEWPKTGPASDCTQCKVCEKKCPQNIPISEIMPIIDRVLGGTNVPYDDLPLPVSLFPGNNKNQENENDKTQIRQKRH